MLVIRLARTGRKKYPTYRVVAADSRRPTNGKFVSILGHYNPHTKDLSLKKEEIESYITKGAQPSNSVIRLLEKEKVKMPEWVSYHSRNKVSKQEAEPAAPAAEAAPADTEAPTEPTEEQPAKGAEAEVATEEVQKVSENAKNEEVVETAESDQAEADKAEKAEEVSAEVAVDAAEEEAKQA